MADYRFDNLEFMAAYVPKSDHFVILENNETRRYNEQQLLMMHNQITNALQDKVNLRGGYFNEIKKSDINDEQ